MLSMKSITLVSVSVLPNNSLNNKVQNSNAGRPTMCRSCGSIVGGGQQQCAVCGTSVSGSGQAPQPRTVADGETMRFARAVLNRPYKFTIVLLVANVFVFILMWQASGIPLSVLQPIPNEVLIPFGAKVNYLIQTKHELWRFVTPIFLHVNLLHLMVNMYSLWIVGPYVEKLYGSAKFVVFWVLTGVAGVVASYLTVRPGMAVGPIARFLFKTTDNASAGASGALFGLVGVLFVFGIKFRHELPEGFRRAFGTGLLPMIMLNLFIGYMGRGFIDNAAHLGGLISGALLALVVNYRRPGERSGIAVSWRVLQIAALVLVAISFLKTAQHLTDPLPVQLVTQPAPPTEPNNPAFLNYAVAIQDGQEAFVVAMKDRNPSNIDRAVKNLETAPHLDQESDELREKLKPLLIRAKEFDAVAATSPERNKNKSTLEVELTTEFIAWQKEYNQWLKTSGRNYSGLIQLTETDSQK